MLAKSRPMKGFSSGKHTRHDDGEAFILFPNQIFDRHFDFVKLDVCGSCSSTSASWTKFQRKRVVDSPLAFTPEFEIFLHVTPFALSGIIRADTPFAPAPPVRTAAMQ